MTAQQHQQQQQQKRKKRQKETFCSAKWIASFQVPCHVTNDRDILLYAQDLSPPIKIPLLSTAAVSPEVSKSRAGCSNKNSTNQRRQEDLLLGTSPSSLPEQHQHQHQQSQQPKLSQPTLLTATKIGSVYGIDPNTNQQVLLRTVFYVPELVMPTATCYIQQQQQQRSWSVVMFSIQQSVHDEGCDLQHMYDDDCLSRDNNKGTGKNAESGNGLHVLRINNTVRSFFTKRFFIRSRIRQQMNVYDRHEEEDEEHEEEDEEHERQMEEGHIQIRRGKFCLKFHLEQIQYENNHDCDDENNSDDNDDYDSSMRRNCLTNNNSRYGSSYYHVFSNHLMVELAATPSESSPPPPPPSPKTTTNDSTTLTNMGSSFSLNSKKKDQIDDDRRDDSHWGSNINIRNDDGDDDSDSGSDLPDIGVCVHHDSDMTAYKSSCSTTTTTTTTTCSSLSSSSSSLSSNWSSSRRSNSSRSSNSTGSASTEFSPTTSTRTTRKNDDAENTNDSRKNVNHFHHHRRFASYGGSVGTLGAVSFSWGASTSMLPQSSTKGDSSKKKQHRRIVSIDRQLRF